MPKKPEGIDKVGDKFRARYYEVDGSREFELFTRQKDAIA